MYMEKGLAEVFENRHAISTEQLSILVRRVLHLIAQRLYEQNGKDSYVIAVFTGATAGFSQVLSGLEQLMLTGTEIRIVLSHSAERVYGDRIEERLLPWPIASISTGERWFCELEGSKGVVVPALSVNSLSKISCLMADSVATNLILQALFMGKPVVAAIDGCEPGNKDRKTLALDNGTPALQQALGEHLLRLNDFGCTLVKCHDLGSFCSNVFAEKNEQKITTDLYQAGQTKSSPAKTGGTLTATMVDSALVRRAIREQKTIKIGQSGIITPLALELARQQGLQISKNWG